jgi:hypothetical protein
MPPRRDAIRAMPPLLPDIIFLLLSLADFHIYFDAAAAAPFAAILPPPPAPLRRRCLPPLLPPYYAITPRHFIFAAMPLPPPRRHTLRCPGA